jgi:hypothetical protein
MLILYATRGKPINAAIYNLGLDNKLINLHILT